MQALVPPLPLHGMLETPMSTSTMSIGFSALELATWVSVSQDLMKDSESILVKKIHMYTYWHSQSSVVAVSCSSSVIHILTFLSFPFPRLVGKYGTLSRQAHSSVNTRVTKWWRWQHWRWRSFLQIKTSYSSRTSHLYQCIWHRSYLYQWSLKTSKGKLS